MAYLIIHKSNLMVDQFTYGDWRQYVAMLPNDKAVCVRASDIPTTLVGLGVLVLAVMITVVLSALLYGVDMAASRVGALALFGTGLMLPAGLLLVTGWRVVVPIGPIMAPREDGTFWRLFPGEDDE